MAMLRYWLGALTWASHGHAWTPDVDVLDLTATDPALKNFWGGFTDGTYGYLVPNVPTKAVRFNLSSFADVQTLELGTNYFVNGFADLENGYGYVVPYGFTSWHSTLTRFGLSAFDSVETKDLSAIDGRYQGFVGGCVLGSYGYIVGYHNSAGLHGIVLRWDRANWAASVNELNLAAVDADLVGFGGVFTDGDHVFAVPYEKAKVARFDTTDFTAGAVASLDLSAVNGARGLWRDGFSDGTWGYVMPFHYSNVVRFKLATFGDAGRPASDTEVLDVSVTDASLTSFSGGFTDGHYGYLVPYGPWGHASNYGTIVRFDLETFSRVEFFDLLSQDSELTGFMGSFVANDLAYLVPLYSRQADGPGKVARISVGTTTSTTSTAWMPAVDVLDLTATDPALINFWGGFTDGTYGYVVPNIHTKMVRFNLTSFSGVQTLELGEVGFAKGFIDPDHGYGYVVPLDAGDGSRGLVKRFGLGPFDAGSVEGKDLAATDARYKGFAAGFVSGDHAYLVGSGSSGVDHGIVLRWDRANWATVEELDLGAVDAELVGFAGSFTDCVHVFAVPYEKAKVARFDTRDFTAGAVASLDLSAVNGARGLWRDGFSDGTWGYVLPYKYSNVVRFKLATFGDAARPASDTEVLNVPLGPLLSPPDASNAKFSGGFTDGHYGYLVPYGDWGVRYHGKVVRFDLETFTTWEYFDLAAQVDSDLTGFMGSFVADSWAYLVPLHARAANCPGKVARVAVETTSTVTCTTTTTTTSLTATTTTGTTISTSSGTTTGSVTSTTSRTTATGTTSSTTSETTSGTSTTGSGTSTSSLTSATSSSTATGTTSGTSSETMGGTSTTLTSASMSATSTSVLSSSLSSSSSSASSSMSSNSSSTSSMASSSNLRSFTSLSMSSTNSQSATTMSVTSATTGSTTESSGPAVSSSGSSASSAPEGTFSSGGWGSSDAPGSLAFGSSAAFSSLSTASSSALGASTLAAHWSGLTTGGLSTSSGSWSSTTGGPWSTGSTSSSSTVSSSSTTASSSTGTTSTTSHRTWGAAMLARVRQEALQTLQGLGNSSRAVVPTPTGTLLLLGLAELAAEVEAKGALPVPVPEGLGVSVRATAELLSAEGLGGNAPKESAIIVRSFNTSEIEELEGPSAREVLAVAAIEFRDLAKGGKLEVSGLQAPVRFTLPARYVAGMACAFWEEARDEWSTEGMKVHPSSVLGSDIVCETRHFSLFGAIIQGIVQTLACANFDILNAEGISNIFRGDWHAGWGGLLCGGLLALLLGALGSAAWLDTSRKRRFTWQDEFFLMESPSEPMPAEPARDEAEDMPKQEVWTATALGSAGACCGWMKSSSGVAEALEDICSSWFDFFGELRSTLEECAGLFEGTSFNACSANLHKTAVHLILRTAKRSAATEMAMSDDLLEFVMEDKELRELLVANREAEASQNLGASESVQPHSTSRVGEWTAAESQAQAWHLLHDEVSHHLMRHVHDERHARLLRMAKSLLLRNPLGAAFTLDLFRSCKQRVLLVAAEFWGALALSCVFYEASGEVSASSKKKGCDVEDSEGLAESVGRKVGRIIVIATASIVIGALPVMFLESLQTKGFKTLDTRGSAAWKRQLRVWVIQERIFWGAGLLYLAFCAFYVLAFLANIELEEQGEWSLQGIITVLEDFLLLPLFSLCAVHGCTKVVVKAHSLRSGDPPADVHRHAGLVMLNSSSNLVLPITQV